MKIFYKNEVGNKGTYWNIENGTRQEILEKGYLDGSWIKAHILLVLSVAPLLGLLFAVFLPAVGIVMAIHFLGKKLYEGLKALSAQSINMSWRPLEAYLTGRKKKKSPTK